MLFLLALAVGVILGALGLNFARSQSPNQLVHFAGAVAGFIIGYAGTYLVVANIR